MQQGRQQMVASKGPKAKSVATKHVVTKRVVNSHAGNKHVMTKHAADKNIVRKRSLCGYSPPSLSIYTANNACPLLPGRRSTPRPAKPWQVSGSHNAFLQCCKDWALRLNTAKPLLIMHPYARLISSNWALSPF